MTTLNRITKKKPWLPVKIELELPSCIGGGRGGECFCVPEYSNNAFVRIDEAFSIDTEDSATPVF